MVNIDITNFTNFFLFFTNKNIDYILYIGTYSLFHENTSTIYSKILNDVHGINIQVYFIMINV